MIPAGRSVDGDPGPLAKILRLPLEQRILRFVVDGVARWEAHRFRRSGETELEFTVAVLGCMLEVKLEQNLAFVPLLEQLELSDDVLLGITTPKTAPRVDINIMHDLQYRAYFSVECKRVAPTRLAREYVREGIMRYVLGKYAADKAWGMMLGYVIDGLPNDVIAAINHQISLCVELDPIRDQIAPGDSLPPLKSVYVSKHLRPTLAREIQLHHLLYDVRHRPPLSSHSGTSNSAIAPARSDFPSVGH